MFDRTVVGVNRRTVVAVIAMCVIGLAGCVGVSVANVASASASIPALIASDPAAGSTVGAIDAVSLQFDIAVDPRQVSLNLSGPAEISVDAPAGVLSDKIELPLGVSLADGEWVLSWEAAGADGDIAFTVESSSTEPVPATTGNASGVPAVPVVGGGELPVVDAPPESAQAVKLPVNQLIFMGLLPIVASLAIMVVAGRRRRALIREADHKPSRTI